MTEFSMPLGITGDSASISMIAAGWTGIFIRSPSMEQPQRQAYVSPTLEKQQLLQEVTEACKTTAAAVSAAVIS
jgi:hypothetical protein